MPSRQAIDTKLIWKKRLTCLTLAGACMACLPPSSAEAQIFGGRVRNWLRGNSPRAERIQDDRAVIIERSYAEPRIVLPGDPEPGYEPPARYSDRTDYGPGVSERGRRESRLSIRRRAARPADDYELEADAGAERSRGFSTDRATVDRRSVLRTPNDQPEREEMVGEPRRGERTLRVDRFEKSASVRPAEDFYEHDESPRDPRTPRSDDLVRPAAAEEVESAELPAAIDRQRPEAIDEFDMPRSARDTDTDDAVQPVAPRPKTESRLPAPPPTERERPRPNGDDDLLPPPPDDE